MSAVRVRCVLKPFGVTTPKEDLMADDWTAGRDLADYHFITGPSSPRKPPDIGKPTTVVFHAVGFSRIFAIAEVTGLPDYRYHSKYKDRFPWVFPARVDLWVPLISDGPVTKEVVTQKALGRIQRGSAFANLTADECARARDALLARPTVQVRAPS